MASNQTPFVKLVRWNQPNELQEKLFNELVIDLGLKSVDDELGFELCIGGTPSEFNGRTNVFFNSRCNGLKGASEKAEMWQILTPVRQS